MNTIITSDIFDEVLVAPILRGARDLFIVSGYASAAMVTRQFEYSSKTLGVNISIDLHVGMTGKDGLTRSNLMGMQAIPRQSAGQNFNCSFSPRGTSNHSKVYVWCSETGPVEAFLGSSNFTQTGFGLLTSTKSHVEACVRVDPNEAFAYVLEAAKGSIGYHSGDIQSYIDIIVETSHPLQEETEVGTEVSSPQTVVLPLVQVRGKAPGEIHSRSGLNWGQRDGREPNQAYIPIPSQIAKSNFFPPKGVHFQIITNDGQAFICTVAQDGDKALETPFDNAILGKYFRRRLGLHPGSYVTTEDLDRFGSSAVRVYKISEDSYRLDFSPGIKI